MDRSVVIELSNELDRIYDEHIRAGRSPEASAKWFLPLYRMDAARLVAPYESVQSVIKKDDGYTIFSLEDDTWEVARTKFGGLRKVVRFAAYDGKEPIKVAYFERTYCIFHNWRGNAFGEHDEPFVCLYGYRSLRRKMRYTAKEAGVRTNFGICEQFVNALNEYGFDTKTRSDAETPSVMIYNKRLVADDRLGWNPSFNFNRTAKGLEKSVLSVAFVDGGFGAREFAGSPLEIVGEMFREWNDRHFEGEAALEYIDSMLEQRGLDRYGTKSAFRGERAKEMREDLELSCRFLLGCWESERALIIR
jgi:hypothetical protein